MNIYKGKMITCDEKNHVYDYLIEENGKIVYVGNTLPRRYYGHKIIDLKNQALIPAFVDSHTHFASYATFHSGLNVMDARSNVEILKMLKEFVSQSKDSLIIGFGASPYSVEEKCLVTRKQLDEICPSKPLFLVKYDGHACIVNTCLLNKIKKKAQHLRGYHEESGEMNQEAFFVVSNYITNSIPIFKLLKDMQKAVDHFASKGIGMIHSVSGVGFSGDLDVDLERGFANGINNGFQMRIFMQTMNVKKALKRKLKRIGGCFENALDGCFGSKDAALLRPYELSDNQGILYYTDQQVIDFCKKANRAGLQIELHAIGDAAFNQAVKGIQSALDDTYRESHRHTIIHACLPTLEGIKLCKIYGMQLAVQPAFNDWPQEPDEYLSEILGERSKQLNPLKTFHDYGILLSAGSDSPCTEPNPIEWLHKACNHGDQSLTIQEALKMCTYNGYYTTFDENTRGSLEVGKIADMVLLSENPYEVPTDKINTLVVEQLYLNGKKYQSCKQNTVLQVLKGLIYNK